MKVLSPPSPADSSQTVPFADAVTIARVVGALEARIRDYDPQGEFEFIPTSDRVRSFLSGLSIIEWSLRLTHSLRYSLALDPTSILLRLK